MKNIPSLVVFVTITATVMTAAGWSLKAGYEKDSNVKRVVAMINRNEAKSLLASGVTDGAVLAEHTQNPCGIQNYTQLQSTNSVVDFLHAQGKSFNFENRLNLANKLGIEDYKGTAVQNVVLLSKLKKDSGCFTN